MPAAAAAGCEGQRAPWVRARWRCAKPGAWTCLASAARIGSRDAATALVDKARTTAKSRSLPPVHPPSLCRSCQPCRPVRKEVATAALPQKEAARFPQRQTTQRAWRPSGTGPTNGYQSQAVSAHHGRPQRRGIQHQQSHRAPRPWRPHSPLPLVVGHPTRRRRYIRRFSRRATVAPTADPCSQEVCRRQLAAAAAAVGQRVRVLDRAACPLPLPPWPLNVGMAAAAVAMEEVGLRISWPCVCPSLGASKNHDLALRHWVDAPTSPTVWQASRPWMPRRPPSALAFSRASCRERRRPPSHPKWSHEICAGARAAECLSAANFGTSESRCDAIGRRWWRQSGEFSSVSSHPTGCFGKSQPQLSWLGRDLAHG